MFKEILFEQVDNNGEAPQGVLASQVEARFPYRRAANIGLALVGGGSLLVSGCIGDNLKVVRNNVRYRQDKIAPAGPIGEGRADSVNTVVIGQEQSAPDLKNAELFPCDPNAAKQDNCIPVSSSEVGGNN